MAFSVHTFYAKFLYLMDNGQAEVVSFGDVENGFIVHAERR